MQTLACHFKNACDIQLNTRKDCAKCRLDKCLHVGMKQNQVAVSESDGTGASKGRKISAASAGTVSPVTVATSLAIERDQQHIVQNAKISANGPAVAAPPIKNGSAPSSCSSSPIEPLTSDSRTITSTSPAGHVRVFVHHPPSAAVSGKRSNSVVTAHSLSSSSNSELERATNVAYPFMSAIARPSSEVRRCSSASPSALSSKIDEAPPLSHTFLTPQMRFRRALGSSNVYSVRQRDGREVVIQGLNNKQKKKLAEIDEASKSLQVRESFALSRESGADY